MCAYIRIPRWVTSTDVTSAADNFRCEREPNAPPRAEHKNYLSIVKICFQVIVRNRRQSPVRNTSFPLDRWLDQSSGLTIFVFSAGNIHHYITLHNITYIIAHRFFIFQDMKLCFSSPFQKVLLWQIYYDYNIHAQISCYLSILAFFVLDRIFVVFSCPWCQRNSYDEQNTLNSSTPRPQTKLVRLFCIQFWDGPQIEIAVRWNTYKS